MTEIPDRKYWIDPPRSMGEVTSQPGPLAAALPEGASLPIIGMDLGASLSIGVFMTVENGIVTSVRPASAHDA